MSIAVLNLHITIGKTMVRVEIEHFTYLCRATPRWGVHLDHKTGFLRIVPSPLEIKVNLSKGKNKGHTRVG